MNSGAQRYSNQNSPISKAPLTEALQTKLTGLIVGLISLATLLIGCSHGRVGTDLSTTKPPSPVEEIVAHEPAELENLQGIPPGCVWNLTGVYGAAEAFSPKAAALRFLVQDDGIKLTLYVLSPESFEGETKRKDFLRFHRTPHGFIQIADENFENYQTHRSNKRHTIIDCGRTHLTIHLSEHFETSDHPNSDHPNSNHPNSNHPNDSSVAPLNVIPPENHRSTEVKSSSLMPLNEFSSAIIRLNRTERR